MSFKAKVDYCGLANSTTIECTDSTEGKSASVATALGQDGSIVASEVYGETRSASCTYKLKGDVASLSIKLGGVTTINFGTTADPDNHYFCLKSVTVSTSAGGEVGLTANAEEVNSSTESSTYTVTLANLKKAMKAQILDTAFTLTGEGCHLNSSKLAISCTVSKTTKDGECIAWDCSEGTMAEDVEIVAVGSAKPTVTAGTNYTLTSPVTETNPDANYPTYNAALTRYLVKDTVSA